MPPKAMYLEMETDPSIEADCFLAEKLGKTLGEIRAMPAADWVTLSVYYGRKAQRAQLAGVGR